MPGPDPAVAAVRSAVRRVLAEVDAGDLVLAACSGGADSVALASALAFEAPRAGLRAGIVHVDHALAADSAIVAAAVEGLAKELGELGASVVEVARVDATAAPGGSGPEARAREARYEALVAAAEKHRARLVLLGHTLDDQAETVLLGLARGSGARSLAGMAPARGIFARPLLGVRRSQTRRYCEALHLAIWDDPSNDDARFARNRVRARVLPVLEAELGPGVAEALARTASSLRSDADALDALAAAEFERLATLANGTVTLPVDVLATLPDAVRRRVLQRAALTAGVPAGALGSVHLGAMDELVTSWHGQGAVALPDGLAATRRYASLHVAPAPRDWSSA
jgi:tRNA(Ile)-lysidine synthase